MSTAAVWPMTASQRRTAHVSGRPSRRGFASGATREGIGFLYRPLARAQWRGLRASTAPRPRRCAGAPGTCAPLAAAPIVRDRASWIPMSAAEPAIAVDRLAKTYKSAVAVDGISFALERGSITGLLGGNGAGKTTTIAMIIGLVIPTSGSVTVLGTDMARYRHRILHRMNFESPYVEMPMRLTIRQNLTVFGRLYGVAGLADRIAALADELELADLLDRPTGKLSSGQRTRVSLAKALINHPEVLLLDEP